MSLSRYARFNIVIHVYCNDLGGADPDQKLIDVRMKAIKKKVLVLSGKGGKKW